MKKTLQISNLIILCCLMASMAFSANTYSSIHNDQVVFASDRNLYITGEKVRFSAFITNKTGEVSRVLYVEIVTPEGERIAAGKFPITNQKARGSLSIPNETATGTFFIKSYTKWMRNFSTNEYSFTKILIINPYRDEVQKVNIQNNSVSSSFKKDEKPILLELKTDKNFYQPRETVSLSIGLNKETKEYLWATLSVVPSESLNGLTENVTAVKQNGHDTTTFQPEALSLTLSGRVTDSKSKKFIPYTKVNLSILGRASDFIATRTDPNGFFNINLPAIYGKHELYIGIEETENATLKIDNDYCTKKIYFPTEKFSLSETERIAAEKMVKNIEVQKLFEPKIDSSILEIIILDTLKPFYGSPDNTFLFEKYISLLSVEEYFKELILNVSVRKKEGKPYFRIFGNYPEMQVYQPLILMDLVAVDEAQRILEANPENFSRIEIISKPYYKGDMIFGGIISFFSKKGDMAGIDLPPTDMFLEFDFFSSDTTQLHANIELPTNVPDTRNTVLWIDDATDIINQNGTVEIFTPDTPGEYTILIRGLKKNGDLVTASKTIIVE